MNDIYDWIMFFLFAICTIITGVSVYKWTDWKRESNENLSLYLNTKLALDKTNEELKTYKDMERVIKIEKFTMQPKELECKFMLHERFVDDTELFKKVITSEVARYMAEEIERDPYLCMVYHSVNSFDCREDIRVRFRMLPYPEGVIWEDIFKEEKEC